MSACHLLCYMSGHVIVGLDDVLKNLSIEACAVGNGIERVGVFWQAVTAIATTGVDIARHGGAAPPLVFMENSEGGGNVDATYGIGDKAHFIAIADEGCQKGVRQVLDELASV